MKVGFGGCIATVFLDSFSAGRVSVKNSGDRACHRLTRIQTTL